MWQCAVTDGDSVREAEVSATQRVRALPASEELPNPSVARLAASALTKWGVFEAGRAPTADPECAVGPQRLRGREVAGAGSGAARR